MAWARRAGATLAATANTGQSPNFGNLGATPTSGDRIILCFALGESILGSQPTITSITDSGSHAWNRDFLRQHTFAYFGGQEVWTAVANGSAVNAITPTFNHTLTGVAGVALAAGAYSGIDTSVGAAAALDISVGADGTAVASTADSGTTAGTTAGANELKIGFYGPDDGQNAAISAGTVDTTYSKLIQAQSTTEQAMLEDADSGSAGSTAQAQATYTGTHNWMMSVLVYKLTGGGGRTTKNTRSSPLGVDVGMSWRS